MDTEILVIGAGPAGLAVAADADRSRPPSARDREGGARRRVLARSLRAAALCTRSRRRRRCRGLPFPDRRPTLLAAPARRRLPERLRRRAPASRRASVRRRRAIVRSTAAGAGRRRRARRRRDPPRRGRRCRHRRQQHPAFVPTVDGRGQVRRRPSVHSRGYRSAAPFAAVRVLVVGMGNTGAEIALDLAEQGVRVSAASVRSPVERRLPRRPRPADAADVRSRFCAPADCVVATRSRALAVRRHGRRPRPLAACVARAISPLQRAARARCIRR